MVRPKGKSPSFDAMVKFFMQRYEIPTKKDFARLIGRLENLEKLLLKGSGRRKERVPSPSTRSSAADTVLAFIGTMPRGVGLKEIATQTGYTEKKVRNLIYRLHREGRIRRQGRGLYGMMGQQPAAR